MTEPPTQPVPAADEADLESELDRATDREYAAVSTHAVLGVAAAALGVVAFLAEPLVVVPLVATILSAWGLRRIRRSRGVLTGRRLALAGLGLGLALALGAGGYHAWRWFHLWRTLTALEAEAGAIVDEVAARRWVALFDRIAPDSPQRRMGADRFRERLVGLLAGAGEVQERLLRSLQVLRTERGEAVALADLVLRTEHRELEFQIWFQPDAEGRWRFIGLGARETFASAARRGTPPPRPLPGPFQRG